MDVGGHEKAMKKTARELDNVLEKWLREHKRKRYGAEGEKDFMDAMLSVLDGKSLESYDADTINKATSLAFEISTPTDAAIDMTPGIGLTNMKTTPLEVVVSPRLPPCCYE
ncbi:hypothetical protein GH714_014170 [Hevea brasiliensis]|uniref:Uncharacterized protein n=1 Tax=Hevea brasiliensis TaxID=3981 RepID=A0A6A6NH47_HEVBR|nr:hypothetical protein GH714_014170 [Hevea brasiliensis]